VRGPLGADSFRQFLLAGLAVPLLERLVRDLAFDQQLRKLSPLRLTLEWHLCSLDLFHISRAKPRVSGVQQNRPAHDFFCTSLSPCLPPPRPVPFNLVSLPSLTPMPTSGLSQPARYRLGLFVNVNNLMNYGGYSGVTTSPFFEQPTMVFNPRRIDVGMNVNF
jgi:hypothetical protein